MKRSSLVSELADFCTLCYHEARNVRFLIKEGLVDADKYGLLRELSTNRCKAWAELQSIRQKAGKSEQADQELHLFEERFGLGLQDLVELFENGRWRASAFGGNKWKDITTAVKELSVILEGADRLAQHISEMPHNTTALTGKNVGAKLRELDECIATSEVRKMI
jgi:hypothetical protein